MKAHQARKKMRAGKTREHVKTRRHAAMSGT